VQIKYLNPLTLFVFLVLILYFIPSVFIIEFSKSIHGVTVNAQVAELYHSVNAISFFAILCAILSYMIIGGRVSAKIMLTSYPIKDRSFKNLNLVLLVLLVLSIALSIPFLLTSAIPKALMLGSDIDGHTFRLLGFDDVNRAFSWMFEIARRIIFPLVILTGLVFKSKLKMKKFFLFSILVFFLDSFLTFDRGPALLFLIVVFLGSFLGQFGRRSLWTMLIYFTLTIAIVGGVLTIMQYNSSTLNATEIFGQSLRVLYSRIIFDPAFMSLEYTFHRHYLIDPLFLEHSRIGVLVGKEYVGSANVNSQFITPVGFVADIWRNFGIVGVFIFSYMITCMFAFFSYQARRMSITFLPSFSVLMTILSASLIYGVLFSLGTFFLIGVSFFLVLVSRIRF